MPVFSPLPTSKCYSFVKTCTQIEHYFGDDVEKWPALLRSFKEEEKDLGLTAYGLVVAFLKDALVDE